MLLAVFDHMPIYMHPDQWIGFHVPGIEILIIILVVWVTGILVANIVGKHLVKYGEFLVEKLPLVRSIYSGVKKIMEIMVNPQGQAFRQVVLISFPQKGSWVIGLVTRTEGDSMTVFVPTTPNPTSGYVITVKESEAEKLDMSVDEALQYIISLGTLSHSALSDKFQIVTGEKDK